MTEENFEIPLIWVDLDVQPVVRVNQFLVQTAPDPTGRPEEIQLTLGHVSPPVVMGAPEDVRVMMGAIGALNVKTLARVSLSRANAEQLRDFLDQQLRLIGLGRAGNEHNDL